MKKIPTIFKRNPDNMRELTDECHPDCLWVFKGEGVATRKYDGTACMIDEGILYKRREIKSGQTVPENFIEEDFDPNTGKIFGWVQVDLDSKDDKWHAEAFRSGGDWPNGTYELVGPKVQGNKEEISLNALIKHSEAEELSLSDRTMEGIKVFLSTRNIEGIVFHHPDGRMAKIKKRDFGMKRV